MSTALNFPPIGIAHQLAGAAIATAYGVGTVSNPLRVGRANIVRFQLHITLDALSSITSLTVKLKHRFNHGGVTLDWIDLPSKLYDVIGGAQPKGNTYEIEHAFGSLAAANQYKNKGFLLDFPDALSDLAIDIKADQVGVTGDSVIVYAVAA